MKVQWSREYENMFKFWQISQIVQVSKWQMSTDYKVYFLQVIFINIIKNIF